MSNSSSLRCTVVVVNYNGAAFVLDCLRSLLEQQVSDSEIEVVVVDNGSVDGSDTLIEQQLPLVRLIRSTINLGFAGGVNVAIANSDGDLVVLLNNDAIAGTGFVAAIIAPFRKAENERLAAVTGRIVLTGRFVPAPDDAAAYVSATGRRWIRVPAELDSGIELLNSTGSQLSRSGNARDRSWLDAADSGDAPAEVFGFCGGAVALRRAALNDAGVFDDALFMYYEDVDLSWRLRRRGWRIQYASDAVVRHQHAASSGTTSRLFLVHNIRNRVLVTARNGPRDMVVRAVVRTFGNLTKSLLRSLLPRSGRAARSQVAAGAIALVQLVRMLPAVRADGRRQDRRAPMPREFITPWLLPD